MKPITYLKTVLFLFFFLLCSNIFAQSTLSTAWDDFFNNKRDEARALFTKATSQRESAAEAYLGLSLLSHMDRSTDESVSNFRKFCEISKNPQPYLYALWSTESINPTNGKRKPEELAFFKSITENKDYDGMLAAMASSMIGKHFETKKQYDKSDLEYSKIGAIDKWQITGEFENISTSGFDKNSTVLDHPQANAVFTNKHGAKVGWHTVNSFRHDRWFDFTFYGSAENSIMYAQTFIKSDKDIDAQLRIGVSGSVKVWVNDGLLLTVPEERNNDLDSYIQTVKLNKGYNRVLVQIGESYAERSNFLVRITDNTGHPVTALTCEAQAQPYTKAVNVVSQKYEPFAISYFEDEAKKHPELPLPRLLLAEAYLRNERTFEARLLIDGLIKKYPNSSFLNLLLFDVFNREKNRTGAETLKEIIKNTDPNLSMALIWKYREYNSQKEYDKAREVIKQIEKQQPELGEFIYESKINLASADKNQDEVIKLGEAAYLKYPDNVDFVDLQYAIEKQVKKNQQAVDVYKKYVDSNDNYGMAKKLADLYFTAGNGTAGLKVLEDEVKSKPYGSGIYSYLGNQYYNLQQYNKAEECYLNCAQIAPTISYYYSSLGKINEMMNHKDKAIQYYQKCLTLNPNDYESIKQLRTLQNKKDVFTYFKEPDVNEIIKNAPKTTDYPDDNVVTLNQEVQRVVYAQGGSEEKKFMTIKILNQKGIENWKEYKIDYDNWENLFIELAEVIKANGNKVPAETNENNLVFTNLEVGDVINIRYRTKSYPQGKLSGYFWDSYYFSSGRPFVKTKYSLLIERGQKFNYKFSQTPIQPVKTPADEFDMYVWQKNNQQSIQYEDKMPPLDDVANVLFLTSIPDWKFISDWYNDIASAKARNNYEVKEVVHGLFNNQPDLTTLQKVKSIYDYITKTISYSEVSFRQSGIIPQNPADIINTRIGDCKDVATLFVAMCKEAGIKSQLVLVKTRDNGLHGLALPSIDFNHCMAKVNLNNQDYYIELTSKYLPFRSIYDSALNSSMLDIGDNNPVATVKYLNPATRQQNNVIRNTSINFRDKDILINEHSFTTAAQAAAMREAYYELSNKDQLKKVKEAISSQYPDNDIIDLNFKNLDKLNSDTVYSAINYELKNAAKQIAGLNIFSLPWSGKLTPAYFQIVAPRYSGIDISQIFPMDSESETITLTLPANKKIVDSPSSVVLTSDIIDYSLVSKTENDKLILTRTIKFKKDFIPADKAAEFNTFFKKVVEADNRELAMK